MNKRVIDTQQSVLISST